MVEPFVVPIPPEFLASPGTSEWARQVTLYMIELSRPGGVLNVSEETADTTQTQQEKLDLMLITQEVDLDAVEAQAAASTQALADLLNSSPNYNISNDSTLRTLDADDAAGAITTPIVAPAEVENIRDAVLVLADYVATLTRDLKNKGIFGV